MTGQRKAHTAISRRHEEQREISPSGIHRRQGDDVANYDDPPPGALVEEPFARDVCMHPRLSSQI